MLALISCLEHRFSDVGVCAHVYQKHLSCYVNAGMPTHRRQELWGRAWPVSSWKGLPVFTMGDLGRVHCISEASWGQTEACCVFSHSRTGIH